MYFSFNFCVSCLIWFYSIFRSKSCWSTYPFLTRYHFHLNAFVSCKAHENDDRWSTDFCQLVGHTTILVDHYPSVFHKYEALITFNRWITDFKRLSKQLLMACFQITKFKNRIINMINLLLPLWYHHHQLCKVAFR